MEERAERVVGVHAADALDHRLRDRLAIGHDGQHLERGGREAAGLDAHVPRDERSRPPGPSRARRARRPRRAGSPGRRASTSRSPMSASTASRSQPKSRPISGRRERALGDEEQRLQRRPPSRPARDGCSPASMDVRPRTLPVGRSASGAAPVGPDSSRPRDPRSILPRFGRGRTTMGPHGSACSAVTSRRFTSSRSARNVTATTTRSRAPASRSCSTTVGAPRQRGADDGRAFGERDGSAA